MLFTWLVGLSQPIIWLNIVVGLGYLVEYAYQFYLLNLIWYLVVAVNSFIRYVRDMALTRG